MAHLILQLAVVLLVARLAGEVAERWLQQPAVLGELVAGVTIGPFALGALPLPFVGPLFPSLPGAAVPISNELYALAQLGSVVLLFVSGLETNLTQFLRFGPSASAVALGGVVLPFLLGAGAAVAVGLASDLADPSALFLGAILTATSVGITARVLGDMGRLETPEGVTILAAAVIDDVLGILVLTLVASAAGGSAASPAGLALLAARAIGAWLVLTALFLLAASAISRVATWLTVEGAALAVALASALLAAYLADRAGLALIVGAYSAGLALSATHLKTRLQHEVRAVYNVLVPLFFVVTGMLVETRVMLGALGLGLLLTLLASLGKVIGCGLPALLTGFNLRGALRVGVGMLPRGEVALVIASAGLAAGVATQQVFGIAVFVAVATTLLASPLLVPAFRLAGSGLRGGGSKTGAEGR